MIEPVVNQLTGKRNGAVKGSSDGIVLTVPSGQPYQIEINDEYAFIHKAYYRLVVDEAREDVDVKPVTNDGSVGCLATPREGTSRTKWEDQDNIDNSEGNAFRSYVISVGVLAAGHPGFSFDIKRWTKRISDIYGRRDYSRPLQVQVVVQPEQSFEQYVALRNIRF
jgi:hypothetical protein